LRVKKAAVKVLMVKDATGRSDERAREEERGSDELAKQRERPRRTNEIWKHRKGRAVSRA
jgi:hypothetical protein